MGDGCRQVREALERAALLGAPDRLNCVAEIDPTALEQARYIERFGDPDAALYGMPLLVKDNVDVKGLHTTAGSLALEDNIAEADAPVVRNLRRNGAVILGKTNMTEFANYTTAGMPGGYSSRGGQVVHAIDPKLSPSGSSSGSAVAVCAGIVPAAVGTDTSFSVIACAQANGICGLKPPVGALSAEGIIPISHTLDSAGALARSFEDALRLYSAMRDTPFPQVTAADFSGMRIAVNTAGTETVSRGQMCFLKETLKKLRKAGAETEEICQPYVPEQRVIMQWEFREDLENYLQESNAKRKTLKEIVEFYESDPERMLRYGDLLLRAALDETPGGTHAKIYIEAMEKRAEAIPHVRSEIRRYDAVIMTGPTNIMHLCGLPSAAVCGKQKTEDGVPRGLILYGGEETRFYSAVLAIGKMIGTDRTFR